MIERVAVVGAGTMGAGIAQLCAQSGFTVKLQDPFPEALDKARARLKELFDAAVLKGRITAEKAERAFGSMAFTTKLAELEGADMIIEAAPEDLALKRKIFAELSRVCPDSLLATNTSSLAVASIAEAAQRPQRCLGVHFFNPPVAMKLVELIRAPQTSPEAFRAAWDFVLLGLKRSPVDVKDTPGFIVNRVMRPYYVESQRQAAAGCGIAPLDEAARAAGVPLGPFELMDLIGLDVNLSITVSIYEALGKPERFVPPDLQRELVATGSLGRKSGRGFYLYSGGKPAGVNPATQRVARRENAPSPAAAWDTVIGSVIAEAERVFAEGTASKADIDMAIKLAMNFPKGPFEWQKPKAGAA